MAILDEKIVNLLTLKGPQTTCEISNHLSYRASTVGASLRRLVANGDVFRNSNQYTVVYGGTSHKILDEAFKPVFPTISYYCR